MDSGSDNDRLTAALGAFRPSDIAGDAGTVVDLTTLTAALGAPSRGSPHLLRDAARRDPDRIVWPCGCRAIKTGPRDAAWRPCGGHVSRELFDVAAAFAYLLHLRPTRCASCRRIAFDSSPRNPIVSYVVDDDFEPLRLFGEVVPPPSDAYMAVCRCGAEVIVTLSAAEVAFVPLDLVPDVVRLTPFVPVRP